MRVNEYIYRNWANWNFAILKELCEDEGIEWSEELVAYLKNSPGNTNWNLLVDFGIEPYGEDSEEESEEVYELWYWFGNDYPISKSMDEKDTYVTVSHPNKILDKKYDIYYCQDAETDDNICALSGDKFSEYQYSFKIDSFEDGTAIIDGNRNYIHYSCKMSQSHGENWNDYGKVDISEPYREMSVTGAIYHPGIIRFNPGEPQE